MTNKYLIFTIATLLLLILFILDIVLGSVIIPLSDIAQYFITGEVENHNYALILNEFRLPKAITALTVGAALAVSGLQMQTVFRNPLAGPYILGISSGASLGVAIVVMGFAPFFIMSDNHLLNSWTIIIAACVGSAIVLFIIMLISSRVKDIMTILILGILFASATSAIVSILQFFSDASLLKAFIVWSLGSLSNVTKTQLGVLLPMILFGLLVSLVSFKVLNALLLGENYAKSIGLPVKITRFVIFLSTSILAGSVTAFCGPIGFIGIAAPHVTRMLFNSSDHRIVIPGSIIIGGIIILVSDIISQLPGLEQTIPVNSVTALIGIPIVIYLVIKNQKMISVS